MLLGIQYFFATLLIDVFPPFNSSKALSIFEENKNIGQISVINDLPIAVSRAYSSCLLPPNPRSKNCNCLLQLQL